MKPEEQARKVIDQQLQEAGWKVVNRDEVTFADAAVAIREELMQGNHEADYLLLLHGKAVGVIEAKKASTNLQDPKVMEQAEHYARILRSKFPCWGQPLKIIYLANGKDIYLKNAHEGLNKGYSKKTSFFRPAELMLQYRVPTIDDSYAFQLPPLTSQGLRKCQEAAINNFEKSLKAGQKRALIVLATGAGKTHTACTIAYRLLKYTNSVRHILFLVDRNNLGQAALGAFQAFKDDKRNHPFTDSYGVELLRSADQLRSSTSVYISTIQRLYATLAGTPYSEADDMVVMGTDDLSNAGQAPEEEAAVTLPEHPVIKPDSFDLIFIDECHRSIYSTWRAVLEYFGTHAIMLGLTATPIKETMEFFNENIVVRYTLDKSIADDINVPPVVYRIKTDLTENGGQIRSGETVQVTSTYTGTTSTKSAVNEVEFSGRELNRSIIAPDQIRKILQEYKDIVFTKLYPEREPNLDYLPKTLIFAKNEKHAQEVVKIAKEVFARPENDNRFVQTITYSAANSNDLIKQFRNKKDFRIAVTVTLVATGTDVPPLEVLIFLTDIRSEVLYQQMKGRGVRTISKDHLREVTPNADHKDKFYLIDAVGVTESDKMVPSASEPQQLNPTLEKLFEEISRGVVPDDHLLQLAYKINTIMNRGDPYELEELARIAPQLDLPSMVLEIFNAIEQEKLPPYVNSNDPNGERKALVAPLINDTAARKKLIEIAKGYFKVLPQQKDKVLYSGFSQEEASLRVQEFEQYLNEHTAEDPVLQSIKDNTVQPQDISYDYLKSLGKKIQHQISGFSVPQLWADYDMLTRLAAKEELKTALKESADIAGAAVEDILSNSARTTRSVQPLGDEDDHDAPTNLLQLIRFAYHQSDRLESVSNPRRINSLFNLWCGQKNNNFPMNDELKQAYNKLAHIIAANGAITQVTEISEIDLDLAITLMRNSKQDVEQPLYSLNNFFINNH